MTNKERATHENQRGVEVLVALLDVVSVILGCLLVVDDVEIDTRVVALDRLQEGSKSILYAIGSAQRSSTKLCQHRTYHSGSIFNGDPPSSSLSPLLLMRGHRWLDLGCDQPEQGPFIVKASLPTPTCGGL